MVNPSFSYDANGNMTGGMGRTVGYTSYNMTSSINQGTTSASFVYDTEHNRVQQTLTSGSTTMVTTYLNDPLTGVYSERAVVGGTATWRDYIMVEGAIVAVKFSGDATAVRYVVGDHIGSTSVAADESASVVERDSYDAWGKRRAGSSWADDAACSQTSVASRGFTGHEHIDALCLVNMNARIYDPTLGRFLSADSEVPDAYNGQSFNRYAYVDNGPLSATDPSGHTNCAQDTPCPDPMETVHVTGYYMINYLPQYGWGD